jgi:hypothetical protein
MRKVLFISVILIMVFGMNAGLSLSHAAETSTSRNVVEKLKIEDFGIRGVIIGDPLTKAIQAFGKPPKIEKGVYKYPTLEIVRDEYQSDKIGQILVKGEGFRTYRGIGVGDTESNVFGLYGETEKDNQVLYYTGPLTEDTFANYQIGFLIKSGKVAEICIYFVSNL